jgi:hypothetical protein
MSLFFAVFTLASSWNTTAFALDAFPTSPQPSLTPGALCTTPNSRRYPERIAYCERNVGDELKDQIVRKYDATFGYRIGSIGRRNFKIDHYIPLCMGGSNAESNLWPQHPSVYEITDPLEPLLCNQMAKGLMTQSEAVRLIKLVKNDLKQAPRILQSLLELR